MNQNTERNPTPETIAETIKAFLSCPDTTREYVLGYMQGQMAERARWEKGSKKPA